MRIRRAGGSSRRGDMPDGVLEVWLHWCLGSFGEETVAVAVGKWKVPAEGDRWTMMLMSMLLGLTSAFGAVLKGSVWTHMALGVLGVY